MTSRKDSQRYPDLGFPVNYVMYKQQHTLAIAKVFSTNFVLAHVIVGRTDLPPPNIQLHMLRNLCVPPGKYEKLY